VCPKQREQAESQGRGLPVPVVSCGGCSRAHLGSWGVPALEFRDFRGFPVERTLPRAVARRGRRVKVVVVAERKGRGLYRVQYKARRGKLVACCRWCGRVMTHDLLAPGSRLSCCCCTHGTQTITELIRSLAKWSNDVFDTVCLVARYDDYDVIVY